MLLNLVESILTTWDRAVFVAINHHIRSPLLDFLMPRISDLGLGHIQGLALLTVAFMRGRSVMSTAGQSAWKRFRGVLRRQRAWLAPMFLVLVMSGFGAQVVKQRVPRDRPNTFYTENPAGRSLHVQINTVASRPPLGYRGFPSGHTATSVGLATTGTFLLWRKRRGALILGMWALATAIGFSRIYLADHWPLDVVGGAFLGMACGLASLWICRGMLQKPQEESPVENGAGPQVSQSVAGSS